MSNVAGTNKIFQLACILFEILEVILATRPYCMHCLNCETKCTNITLWH